MAIEFKNADSEYYERVESHQKGFLLNRGKSSEPHEYPRLHKASCIFVNKPFMFHPTSTVFFKVCADNRRRLETLAKTLSGTCDPQLLWRRVTTDSLGS